MAVLKTVLNIALDTVASPSVMLRLKDFVLLVCSALGEFKPTWRPSAYNVDVMVKPDGGTMQLTTTAVVDLNTSGCSPWVSSLMHRLLRMLNSRAFHLCALRICL